MSGPTPLSGDDVEPVELEPIDLGDARPPHEPLRVSRRWIALVGAGLAAWLVVALVTHGNDARPTATALPTTAPTLLQPLVDPAPEHPPPEQFVHALQRLGTGRYAIVYDNRLSLVSATGVTPVPLPAGRVAIERQSADALLARTNDAFVFVDTTPLAVNAIPADRFAIPALEVGRWWVERDDGVLTLYGSSRSSRTDEGLQIVAAVTGGWVAYAPRDRAWVRWDGAASQRIAPLPDHTFLGASRDAVAFARNCSVDGCNLEVEDLTGRAEFSVRLREALRSVVFSPDGSRLAVVSGFGPVLLLDRHTGRTLAQVISVGAVETALPVGWTPDGKTLLVARAEGVSLLRAADGADQLLPVAGVQQIVALP